MQLRVKTILKAVLLLTVALILLPGCGDFEARPDSDQDYDYTPTPDVHLVPKQSPGEPTSQIDDPLAKGGDPMAGNGDPMTNYDRQQGADPLNSNGDPMQQAGKTQYWYWVTGKIPTGSLDIAVDGVSIGRYSVSIDKEITPFVHPGENSLTFTKIASGSPVSAHLQVIYSQQEPGAPPVLTYDASPPLTSTVGAGTSSDLNATGLHAPALVPFGDKSSASPTSQSDTVTFEVH